MELDRQNKTSVSCRRVTALLFWTYFHRFTYRLPLVPLRVELLIGLQAEEGVVGHVVHLVVHDPVRLGIKTLQESRSRGKQTQSQGELLCDYLLLLFNPNQTKYHWEPQQFILIAGSVLHQQRWTPLAEPLWFCCGSLHKHMWAIRPQLSGPSWRKTTIPWKSHRIEAVGYKQQGWKVKCEFVQVQFEVFKRYFITLVL